MKKIVVVLLCFLMLSASFCGCSFQQQASGVEFVEDEGVYIAYNQLSSDEKNIYDEIFAQILAGETSFSFELDSSAENDTLESIENVTRAVLDDHPELFWLDSYAGQIQHVGASYKTSTVVIDVLYYYKYNLAKLNEAKELLSEIVDDIVNKAMCLPDDFARVEYVYEYLCSNVIYSDKSYYDPSLNAGEVYECIVNKTSNLNGYAKVFQMIMQRLGIPCACIEGHNKTNKASMWNYLLIDGDYYYVAFDFLASNKYDVGVSHEYLLIDEETLFTTHSLSYEQSYPKCNGYKMNYFLVNNAYISEYSFELMREYINQTNDTPYIEVRFTSKKELAKAYSELINERRALDLPGFEKGFTYSVSASGFVLRIAGK